MSEEICAKLLTVPESKNKEVGRLIFSANGFKNFKRTRNRMLYCLNEEDTFNI